MDLFRILLIIHIAGGTLGLLFGTYIMIAKKADQRHKLNGKIFAVSMLGAGVFSLALASMHRNDFLFAVGVFTIHLVGTGWRYLYLKDLLNGQKPKVIDWALMTFMVVGSLLFLIIGIQGLLHGNYFSAVILLFSWRGISAVIQDYRTFKGKIAIQNYWMVFHFQRMIGAYIASLTAFLVVNAPEKLSFLPWLVPAAVLVPFIVKWSKQYGVPRSTAS